mmetsp:Transcript_12434/g.36635  ORF Transcript_12434/g.36635 Transcript_12434/m.36635 type:complete len:97 (+) Transcript_12434:32-322(+)
MTGFVLIFVYASFADQASFRYKLILPGAVAHSKFCSLILGKCVQILQVEMFDFDQIQITTMDRLQDAAIFLFWFSVLSTIILMWTVPSFAGQPHRR